MLLRDDLGGPGDPFTEAPAEPFSPYTPLSGMDAHVWHEMGNSVGGVGGCRGVGGTFQVCMGGSRRVWGGLRAIYRYR